MEEKKKLDELQIKPRKLTLAMQRREQEAESQKRLQVEVMHQTEEAKRRALAKAVMTEAASGNGSLNESCFNLLTNFQGKRKTRSNLIPQYINKIYIFLRCVQIPQAKPIETS